MQTILAAPHLLETLAPDWVPAAARPTWRLFIDAGVTDALAAELSTHRELPESLDVGGHAVAGVDIPFADEFANLRTAIGVHPEKTHALFVGVVDAEGDGSAIFGAGADWWWSCFAGGEAVYERSERHADGNVKASFAKSDWIFRIPVRKGPNLVVLHLVSGMFWTVGCGVIAAAEPPRPRPPRSAPPAAPRAAGSDLAGWRLIGRTTRDPVGYRVGEEVEFVFRLVPDTFPSPAGAPPPARICGHPASFLEWRCFGDDGVLDAGRDPISPDAPVRVKASARRPGFVHLVATVEGAGAAAGQDGPLRFEGGAGADIVALRPAVAAPDDFDDFWALQRRRLAEVPARAEVVPYDKPAFPDGVAIPDSLAMYLVRVDCAGPNPVTGYLAVPRAPGKYPARCVFDGYGTDPRKSHRSMTPNVVTFHVNAHGYELLRESAYYAAFFKPFQKDCGYALSPRENADPNTAYFHGMSLRVIRAFDFLKTWPSWNGRDLIATGGSQGGLQTLWAGSQVEGLTRCEAGIVWCANLAGKTADSRMPGWHPQYFRALDYYDPCFHAARVPETCFFDVTRIGLGDYTCPPSGVTAMYNAVRGPKQAAYYQNSQHMYIEPSPEVALRQSAGGAS